MKKKAKIEYWKAVSGKWYWHIRAANGEIMNASEGYSTKQKCLQSIHRLYEIVFTADVIEIK